ncbi:MAG: hypothetical protein IPK82_22035 [Polyangiaceae bacterium]|nr:hypothetical protein [Polyangiaceae bacterium]
MHSRNLPVGMLFTLLSALAGCDGQGQSQSSGQAGSTPTGGSGGTASTSGTSPGGSSQGGSSQGGSSQGGSSSGGSSQGGSTTTSSGSTSTSSASTTTSTGSGMAFCGDNTCNNGETCVTCPQDCGTCPPALEARFNVPMGDTPDYALEDTVIDLINHAAPGSDITVSVYHFTRKLPAEALIAAKQNKGVNVRVVLDGSNAGNQVVNLLSPVLGADLTLCQSSGGGSCIGSNINHSKFFLFSALDNGVTNVVVQSSANLTNPMLTDHNNLVIARGDALLYQGYLNYWLDQKADQQNLDYYKTIDGTLPFRAYFYPRAQGDTIVSILDNVSCSAGNKKIRLAMSLFSDSRVEIAQKLVTKKQEGCSVVTLLADRDGSPGAAILSTLNNGNVSTFLVTPTATRSTIHSKYLLIDADYQSGANLVPRKLVFTGSHNYTGNALHDNDEQLIRVDDADVYTAFLNNWQTIRNTVP